ncbi:MAG: histidinol-phosphatase [Clostridia bacterium]|nr:histidinol-phosphatase [Clostridia bacterium]
MLYNYHTHTTFCDGDSSPEEIALYAIDRGFDAIGFSGHGNTPFDLRYCMADVEGYKSDIRRIKEKYKNKIQIYLGVEEDAFNPMNPRGDFDYIIGSSHYFCVDSKYYPIDSNAQYFEKCVEAFDNDVLKLAETYYETFCGYIEKRKPDIIGHFDLITKFDEIGVMRFLNNEKYFEIAQKYTKEALKNDIIFEVNTGAIIRGLRKDPYPHQRLLHIIKRSGGKVMLSSDSHSPDTLDAHFDEAKRILSDIGFDGVYVLYDNEFKKERIK